MRKFIIFIFIIALSIFPNIFMETIFTDVYGSTVQYETKIQPKPVKPELLNIEANKTEVDAPGEVEFTAEVSKDMAGGVMSVSMQNEEKSIISLKLADTGKTTEDGNLIFKGTLLIPEYEEPGVYTIYSVQLNSPGNYNILDGESMDILKNLSLIINNNNAIDSASPVITDIKIDDTDLNTGDIATITLSVEDDVSGVSPIYSHLIVENENGDEKYIELKPTSQNIDNNAPIDTLEATFAVDKYTKPGNYQITEIFLYDIAYNTAYYIYDLPEDSASKHIKNIEYDKKIIVNNDYKNKSPIKITKNKVTIEAPNTLNLTAISEKEIKDIEYISVYCENKNGQGFDVKFYNKYWNEDTNTYELLPENTFSSAFEVNTYIPSGTYIAKDLNIVTKSEWLSFAPPTFSITIKNAKPIVQITSIDVEEQKKQIEDLPDTSIVSIYGGVDSSPEVFDTIKSTNKTIVWEDASLFESDLQLVFNGKDITNNHVFNTGHYFNTIDNYYIDSPWTSGYYSMNTVNQISTLVNGKETAILMFENNSELPGKAKLRLSLDYDIRNTIGTENLYVYQYDTENNQLIPIASDISVTADGYLEFDIDKLETYVITKGDINQ